MPHHRLTTCAGVLIVFISCCLSSGEMCGASGIPLESAGQRPSVSALFSHTLLSQNKTTLSDPTNGLDGMRLGDTPGLKSPGKAVLLSLLLPGAGQSYVGAKTKSRVFLSAEAVTWLAYGGFKIWESQKTDEFQSWAAQHSGIDPADKPDDFWRMLTYYDSRRDYEVYGRAGEPDRRSYPNLVGWDWQWDSEAARNEYRQLRNDAKEADRKATFSIGAMVLNRIVAAIDAYRGAKSYNRRHGLGTAETKIRIKGKPFGQNPNVMLVFLRVF